MVPRVPHNMLCILDDIHHFGAFKYKQKQKQTPWSESASELYRPSDRRAFKYNVSETIAGIAQSAERPENSILNIKTKLRGLGPRASSADRVAAACRRKWCQLLRMEGAAWSAWRVAAAVFPVFWTGTATFSSGWLLNCARGAGWTPFRTHCFSEGLVVPGVEPGPLDLWPGALTARPQSRPDSKHTHEVFSSL
jgi:hypothetical protein